MQDSSANPTVSLLQGLPGDEQRFARLLDILRCPASGRPYRWEPVPQKDPGLGVYGILHGDDGAWPVIDTIPILLDRHVGAYEQEGEAFSIGPTPAELVAMIRAGRGREALIECLAIPWVPGVNPRDEGQARTRTWVERRALHLLRRHVVRPPVGKAVRRRQLARLLDRPADEVNAVDLVWHFFGPGSPLPTGYRHYFLYRYGLPRTLASMAMLDMLPRGERPVLDLACGFGHFAHLITANGIAPSTVGVDFNFIPMWMGRRTSFRSSSFVVADADKPLPFADGVFGGAFCSDAFAFIPDKAMVVREMRRTAGQAPLMLLTVHNLHGQPASAKAMAMRLSPEGYLALLAGERSWIFGEQDLVRCYRDRAAPDLDRLPPPRAIAYDFAHYYMAIPEGAPVPATTPALDRPQAAGALQLNPNFTARPVADGGIEVTAWYGSLHFCLQNAQMDAYMPRRTRIDAATLEAIRAGRRTPEVEALIEEFVLIGLPEHFAPDPLH